MISRLVSNQHPFHMIRVGLFVLLALWTVSASALAAVESSVPIQTGPLIPELPTLGTIISLLQDSPDFVAAGYALREASMALQGDYSRWAKDALDRLSADSSHLSGCTIQSVSSDELTACKTALRDLESDHKASLRLIGKLDRLESFSDGRLPYVLGAMIGASGGIVVLLAVAFIVLRRGETRRFGGVLTSHPLRSAPCRVLFAAGVVALAVSVVAYFVLAAGNHNPSYEQLELSIEEIDGMLKQLARLPDPPRTQTPEHTILPLVVSDLPLREARAEINRFKKSVRDREELVSLLLRRAVDVRELAAELQERLTYRQLLSSVASTSHAAIEDQLATPIAEARARFHRRMLGSFGVSSAAVIVLLAIIILGLHRRWDDRKRRGSYGGW
ncbi:hypothetical protein KAU37_12100 [Candidatus Bipolaricaulota bacterium]|nr:hypothetical protein [Candidatus Bipolaricaulota bacterium]